MNIGEKIITLRKKKHLTQDTLADMLHLSPQAISKWERGITNPDLELIPKIAELFGISSDELLGIKDSSNQNKNKILASFDFTSMNDEDFSIWKIDGAEVIDRRDSLILKAVQVERSVGTIFDPYVIIPNLNIETDKISRIRVKLKTSCTDRNSQLQVFFSTKDNPHFDEIKSIRAGYPKNNMICVDLPISSPLFCGTLTSLRIDPAYCDGECEIAFIQLIDTEGNIKFNYDFLPDDNNVTIMNSERNSKDRFSFKFKPQPRHRTTFDPLIKLDKMHLDISNASYVRVRMKSMTNTSGYGKQNDTISKIYFQTEENHGYGESKTVAVWHHPGEMCDLYFDMRQNPNWRGILTGIRLDPIESFPGTFEIELIQIIEGSIPHPEKREDEALIDELINRIEELEGLIDDLECRIDDLEELEDRICELEEIIAKLKD